MFGRQPSLTGLPLGTRAMPNPRNSAGKRPQEDHAAEAQTNVKEQEQKAKKKPPQKKSKSRLLFCSRRWTNQFLRRPRGQGAVFSSSSPGSNVKETYHSDCQYPRMSLRASNRKHLFHGTADPEIALTLTKSPQQKMLARRIRALCSFVHRSGSDLRRCIHQMQFWAQGVPTDPAASATTTEFSGTGVESPTGRRALDVILGTARHVSLEASNTGVKFFDLPSEGSFTSRIVCGAKLWQLHRWVRDSYHRLQLLRPGGSDVGALRVYLAMWSAQTRVVARLLSLRPARRPPLFPVPVIVTGSTPAQI